MQTGPNSFRMGEPIFSSGSSSIGQPSFSGASSRSFTVPQIQTSTSWSPSLSGSGPQSVFPAWTPSPVQPSLSAVPIQPLPAFSATNSLNTRMNVPDFTAVLRQPVLTAASAATFQPRSPAPVGTLPGGAPIPQPGPERSDFMRQDSHLSEGENKYCRCLLRVEAKGNAYNPYGVCTKSTRHQVRSCSQYYDWAAMSLDMLLAYCTLHKIDTTGLTTREAALAAIGRWKASRGEAF
jgi:hypothetical protein